MDAAHFREALRVKVVDGCGGGRVGGLNGDEADGAREHGTQRPGHGLVFQGVDDGHLIAGQPAPDDPVQRA